MDGSYDISLILFTKTEDVLLSIANDGKLTFPSLPRMYCLEVIIAVWL